ncbi:MAG: transporter substrate-binding domain-containing protein [Cellvibrionaceae bacterium]|nr:transporter substrate-binding domain-containing protein [Cellvibrionaceae bacterium]
MPIELTPMRIVIVVLLILGSICHADTYRVAAYAWEPFIDANRADGGLSIALIRKIMQRQNHSIEVVPLPWARSLAMLEKNQIDILPAIWFTEKRGKTMLYSEQYAANRLVFIKPKDSDYEFEGLTSLHNKVVGVVRDYAYDESFLNEKNIRFSVSDSLNSNVKKVIAGRADLTLDDEIVAKTTIKPTLLQQLSFTKNPLKNNPLYISCNKSNPKCKQIISAFNRGLSHMQADRSLEKLFNPSDY